MAHLVKPSIVRYVDADGKRCPKQTPGAKKTTQRSRKWYGKGIAGFPPTRRVPLAADKRVAQKMLQDLEERAERGQAGMADLGLVNASLLDHLARFERSLRDGGATDKHVREKVARVRRVLTECGFAAPPDIRAEKVERFLAELRADNNDYDVSLTQDSYTRDEVAAILGVAPSTVLPLAKRHRLEAVGQGRERRFPRATVEALLAPRSRGASAQTSNHHLSEVRSFTRWLVAEDVLMKDPLVRLKTVNAQVEPRRARRHLEAAELVRLLSAAEASAATFRGLAGIDRFMIYLTALGTGFRENEVASLLPEYFDLDSSPPAVVLPARKGKNRKPTRQPLPASVATALRAYLSGKPAGEPIWPGGWSVRGADMLKIDLSAAAIPYVIVGPDGPLYADFHALRHTYITLLEKAGVSIKQAMVLARHSDPALTIGRYTHATLIDLGKAVDGLPVAIRPALPVGGGDLVTALATAAAFWFGVARVLLGQAAAEGQPGKETEAA